MMNTIEIEKISPKIIRAWFDTILNPMLNGLENELYFLNKNNHTWRGFTCSFEELKPLFNFCDYRYHGNFEQINYFYADILNIIDLHDSKLGELERKTTDLFNELKQSSLLIDIYNNAVNDLVKENPQIDDNTIQAFRDSRHYRFVAEYLINDYLELPPEYSLSTIWNRAMLEFKELLSNGAFSLMYNDMLTAKESFKTQVSKSLDELKKFRFQLSINSGEPIVMSYEKN